MNFKIIVFLVFVSLYGLVFSAQERRAPEAVSLELALPVKFYTIAAGYLSQLSAEMLFIKTSVFLGGLRPGTPPESYQDELSNNFKVMTELYPEFVDPYYFCQAFLSPISPEAARQASAVFEIGIAARPYDLILRFFYGSNFFLAMNEPIKAAKAFEDAAQLPDAPPLFSHLAALLSAKGGDIAAGLISLKTMLQAEKDENVRKRYLEEIQLFEQALTVQRAVDEYTKEHDIAPENLSLLVPEFLPALPEKNDLFVLRYDPPVVRLQRPESF